MERDPEWDQYVDAILVVYRNGHDHHINEVIHARIPEMTDQGIREKFVRYLVAWELLRSAASDYRYTIDVRGAHVVRNEKGWIPYLDRIEKEKSKSHFTQTWQFWLIVALTVIGIIASLI